MTRIAILMTLLAGNIFLFEFLVFNDIVVSQAASLAPVQREVDRNWLKNGHYRGSALTGAAVMEMRKEVLGMIKRPLSMSNTGSVVSMLNYDDVLHLRNLAMMDRTVIGVGIAFLLLGVLAGGFGMRKRQSGPITAKRYAVCHGSIILVFGIFALFFRPVWYAVHLLLFTDPSWKLTAEYSFLPVLFPAVYARVIAFAGLGVNILLFVLIPRVAWRGAGKLKRDMRDGNRN